MLNEYYQMCMTNKAVTEGGLEYARTVLEKAYGEQQANNLLDKVTRSLKNREFAFLNKADEQMLYSALQHERPQTIALVLSYIAPEKAAAVLGRLDSDKQVEVVKGIAKMESASPTAVKLVEAELSKKFSSIVMNKNVKVGGIGYVADVMNNLDRGNEKSIFDGLSIHDSALADEIRKRMFVFEDIVTMDDRSVQRFIRDCDPRDIVLSLKCGQPRSGEQAVFQHVHPYGPEYPGRPGDHGQCAHKGCGRSPAAHRQCHPRSGRKERDHYSKGRKGRYHCLTS